MYKVILIALLLVGCSSSKVLVPLESSKQIGYVALLPVTPPKGTRPERSELVRNLVESEMRSKGFLVVEDQLLKQICTDKECKKQDELFARFAIDALGKLELSSARSRNLGLGYADSVSGKLSFLDRSGQVVEAVSNDIDRGGGFLLNSGQVVKAIESQAQSFRDSTFEPIAREFARGLVAKLAPPAGLEARFSHASLMIGEIEFKGPKERAKILCVNATPESSVVLTDGKLSADLRETDEGRYCGSLRSLGPVTASPFRVELRTAAGLSTEKRFSALSTGGRCELMKVLELVKQKNRAELRLACTQPSCADQLNACEKVKKIVFRGTSAAGPFKRVGEFSGRVFRDKTPGGPAPVYSVFFPADDFMPAGKPVVLLTSGL